MKYENSSWVPVKDVEMKIGIERLEAYFPRGTRTVIQLIQPARPQVSLKRKVSRRRAR